MFVEFFLRDMDSETFEKAAYILKTIAHPTRLAIIEALTTKQELAVNEFCRLLNQEQSVISHHLINMKTKGLLKAIKSGNNVFYSLREQNLAQILKCVGNCNCFM